MGNPKLMTGHQSPRQQGLLPATHSPISATGVIDTRNKSLSHHHRNDSKTWNEAVAYVQAYAQADPMQLRGDKPSALTSRQGHDPRTFAPAIDFLG